ncbi:MAG: M23 family metallopeptidase [Paludibacteraceae bacterium]|nr:M23 family metallopeptidase [Paludibacteraceae bacterium]
MTKRKYILFTIVCILGLAACNSQTTEEEKEEQVVRYEFGLPVDSFRIDTFTVRDGQTLGGILRDLGATPQQINRVSILPADQLDVRSIRAGKTYYALYSGATADTLRYWIYQQDRRHATILHLTDTPHVEYQEKPLVIEERSAEAVIESSLWNAMISNDLPVELALELSEIYAWTIDFFALQQGDSIRVCYDEQYVDSARIGIGRIYACHFYHGGKWQQAYWFDLTDSVSGDVLCRGYFDEKGQSLRKAFLKAPLNYKRISSHFSYARKHPVFKIVRPHTGVDYAAPTGTPVVSIGDGTVIEKGYKGQAGNMVKIRHNSTYTTAYLHLSRYGNNISIGQHVSQGQVIGYVGATGAATGPHLDFRVWKGGSPVDPLKVESPPVEPVAEKYMTVFDSIVAQYNTKL